MRVEYFYHDSDHEDSWGSYNTFSPKTLLKRCENEHKQKVIKTLAVFTKYTKLLEDHDDEFETHVETTQKIEVVEHEDLGRGHITREELTQHIEKNYGID